MKKSGTIVQYTSEELEEMLAHGEDQTDWAKVDALTDEEVEDAIDFADEGFPDWSTAQVGIPGPKQQLTLRLDLEVIDWFKRQGPRYQTRMNEVLKRYVTAQKANDARSRTSRRS